MRRFILYSTFSVEMRRVGCVIHINRVVTFVICLILSGLSAFPLTASAQTTVLYSDDFENPVIGWSINNTDFDADVTQFLGRFDDSPNETTRSFTIPTGTTRVEIEFDFYRFDSWDNNSTWGFDRFQIDVDSTQIFSLPFSTNQSARSGVTGSVSWSITPLGPASHLAFNNTDRPWYQDQLHRVPLIVDAPGPTLDLTLRTALNQGGNDESGGYDNMTVTAFIPVPDLSISKSVEPALPNGYMVPGSDIRYKFTLTSNGASVDNDTLVLVDLLPSEIILFTGDLNGSGQPVEFIDNSVPFSGLSCCTGANIEFSNTTSGAPIWGYIPTMDYDDTITHIRLTPSGGLRNAETDPINIEFSIRARIK